MQHRLVCRQDFSGLYVLITSDLFRLLRNRPVRMSVQPHSFWQCFYTHSRIAVIQRSRFRIYTIHRFKSASFIPCKTGCPTVRTAQSQSHTHSGWLRQMPWCTSPDVTGSRQRNRLPYNSSYISTDYIPDHPTASKVLCRASGGKIFYSYHNADIPLPDTG